MSLIIGLVIGFAGAVVFEIVMSRNGVADNYSELIREWISREPE